MVIFTCVINFGTCVSAIINKYAAMLYNLCKLMLLSSNMYVLLLKESLTSKDAEILMLQRERDDIIWEKAELERKLELVKIVGLTMHIYICTYLCTYIFTYVFR